MKVQRITDFAAARPPLRRMTHLLSNAAQKSVEQMKKMPAPAVTLQCRSLVLRSLKSTPCKCLCDAS
jgi:hypothetical protein